jgi:RAD50-interacting protein 1
VRTQVQAFNQEQADIDQRLKTITQSETSDEAVRRFETSMEKLQRLDVAKGYLSLLQEVETLR